MMIAPTLEMVHSGSYVIHCLQNIEGRLLTCFSAEQRGERKELSYTPIHFETTAKKHTKYNKMPCRKENYILLEQSVTVDSKEVDALVTKIGEALQLHNNSANQKTMSCLHGLTGNCSSSNIKQANNNNGVALQKRTGCCIPLRNRGQRNRASPYSFPGSSNQEWDNFKPWNRKRISAAVENDDPHQLLQELILSGNLIKEAVRRLQFSTTECGDLSDNLQC